MSKDKWNGRRLPKYCIEDVDRYGNIRVYFRRKGAPKVRLPGIPFTEEFMQAYAAALDGKGQAKARQQAAQIKPG